MSTQDPERGSTQVLTVAFRWSPAAKYVRSTVQHVKLKKGCRCRGPSVEGREEYKEYGGGKGIEAKNERGGSLERMEDPQEL